jgi:hypothetical protein
MLDTIQVDAVSHLLHYLWEKEEEDYREQRYGDREGHVFVSLVRLRDALGGDPLLSGELE